MYQITHDKECLTDNLVGVERSVVTEVDPLVPDVESRARW